MITIIWTSLIALGIWFLIILIIDLKKHKNSLENSSWIKTFMIGFVVDFFDTLGIGAFAPQTALLKFTKQTEDRIMPGTLNVSNTIPALIEGIIFIKIIEVDPLTLVLMLLSATAGGVIGAGIVAKLPERKVRIAIAIALLVTAFFMVANNLKWIQGGGHEIGLSGGKLIIALIVNCILGALNTAGIGLFAPCMALVFALGMSPQVAFPIMMGSCAFLMPLASAKFIKEGAYNRKASISMTIAGSIAVIIAAFIVKSLTLDVLRWVVIGVIIYTSVVMLKAAFSQKQKRQMQIE
ncbi:MAG TPA: sulfite exporter TauE/SafE family protein [Segetibacter sp.]|nr:sulfite exporter TauE/SafE family protein [Segetibacter sp.]